ncbi:MAG: AraC family transcriptional regulator [Cyanobacteria bacterium P01_C01_bin.89]
MTFLLSIPEFYRQNPEVAEQRQKVRQPWTVPLNDASGRNHGYRQKVTLRPGLEIQIDDYTLQEELLIEADGAELCSPQLFIEMSFMLSANNPKEQVLAQHNFFDVCWWERWGGNMVWWQPGERILKFDIHLQPNVFKPLLGSELETLPEPLAKVIQSSQTGQCDLCFWQLSTTTPAMQIVIYQILRCPYEGPTRWIYWESKVLELLALRLEELKESSLKPTAKSTLKPDDLDRLHHAREILHKRLASPPSLLELAELAGLNDYKLKTGFKEVFGNTVFGDLRQHRLEQARHLLQERQISVMGAATAVGYANQAHFAAAFRKQFGINPGKLCR